MKRINHILLVEDDPEICSLVRQQIEDNGWRVSVSQNAVEMDRILTNAQIDLIVLDLMLPGEDGLSICRRLRTAGSLPIIIVSARSDDFDRVIGLEIGADDYLPKPFNPRELIARIRAIFRRMEMGVTKPSVSGKSFHFEGWTIDILRRSLLNPEGATVSLTPAEFDLLHVLCERFGRVLSRDQLVDLTQGAISASGGRNIDILISRLRSKLEAGGAAYPFVRTIRSGGYEFVPNVEAK